MFRIARYGSLTVAAGLIVGFLAVTFSAGRQAAAFEKVVGKVAESESVVFMNMQHFGARPPLSIKFSAKGDKFRMEPPGGVIVIADVSEKRGLQLDRGKKEARILTATGGPQWVSADIAGELQRIKPQDVKPLGKQKLDGRTVEVYALPGLNMFGMEKSEAATLYADPETDLPVRIEVVLQRGGKPVGPQGQPAEAVTLVLEKFEWNAPLADELFSLEVPAGYSTVEHQADQP